MTYRNDHDAALARVDALEAEVDRLRKAEEAKPRPPRARRFRRSLGLATLFALSGGMLLGIGIALSSPADDDSRISRLDTRVGRAALDACISEIKPSPNVSNDRLSPEQAVAIELTGAPCRSNLGEIIAEGLWSPSERGALVTWRDAEDRLANAIAMVSTYHQSSPAELDGYASSPQLWREYQRALGERDTALAAWQRLR